MQKHFSENFRLTEDEVKTIWAEAIFVFDTNVLLNLYRMRKETSSKIRDILRKLKGRLFLPHQVSVEFFRHREDEIADQVNTFEKVRSYLAKIPDQFKQAFSRHPCIPISEIANALKTVVDQQIAAVTESQQTNELNFVVSTDPILAELAEIFGDCTEGAYTQAHDDALNKRVEERVQQNLPPCLVSAGGKALPAPTANPHRGDGRVWFQILKHAGEIKKPFIFVTSDEKLNWWRTVRLGVQDRPVGPHFLLIRDIESASGKRFAMYTQGEFLAAAPKYLDVPDQSQGIEETKQIREGVEAEKGAGQGGAPALAPTDWKEDRPKRMGDSNKKDIAVPDPAKIVSADNADKSGEAEPKR